MQQEIINSTTLQLKPICIYRIYSKERLCSKERLLFDMKYLMSTSVEWAPLFENSELNERPGRSLE